MFSRNRPQIVLSLWLLALIVVAGGAMAAGARLSTTALLLLLTSAPMGIGLLLGIGGERSLTNHELMYALEHPKTGRR